MRPADLAVNRRIVVAAGLGALLPARAQQPSPHDPMGPVDPPRPMPPFPLTTHEGARTDAAAILRGRVTAVQLMFTSCSGVCPIQGALFAAVASRIDARASSMQLLSITIDALGDDPAALRRWLARFAAPARWSAAAPRVADVDAIRRFLGGPGSDAGDPHARQVHVFDRQGRLVYRTAELPAAKAVVDAMNRVERSA
jgi:protein SCO1/2